MRILHVVPYVSKDGAYGGPTSVAKVQADALVERGHDVTIACGWDRSATLDTVARVEYMPARRAAGRSFASLVSPRLLARVIRTRKHFDVVHVHAGRDLCMLPLARLLLWFGVRVVIQPHGMLREKSLILARVYDALFTSPALRGASATLALTPDERDSLIRLGSRPQRTHLIRNPAPRSTSVATWRSPAKIVFCSRFAARKRPRDFVYMAQELLRERPDLQFTMAGPDEGELAGVMRAIHDLGLSTRVTYVGAIEPRRVSEFLSDAQVMVLPSINEPFPMIALEAISVGLPCVLTQDTGVSAILSDRGAASLAAEPTADSLADALRPLLGKEEWTRYSVAARDSAEKDFSPAALSATLAEIYKPGGMTEAQGGDPVLINSKGHYTHE